MLNTDSVRMCANLPTGIFGSNDRTRRSGPEHVHHHHRPTGDYFASSADFEYDLFLRGIVSCDSSSATVYRSGTTSAITNRKSLNSTSSSSSATPGFLSRVTQRSSQRGNSGNSVKKNQNSSPSIFSSVTSLNRVAFDPFVPRPPRADSYDTFDNSSQSSMRFCDLSFGGRDDESVGETFKKSSPLYQTPPPHHHHLLHHQASRKSLQTTVIEEELESPPSGQNLSHQQQHALHRFRRQKKKGIISKLRDAVISFTPKSRPSIIGRNDLYFRYGKAEQESLESFNFLEEELRNCCSASAAAANSAIIHDDVDTNTDDGLVDFEFELEPTNELTIANISCDTNQSIPEEPAIAGTVSAENIVIVQKRPQPEEEYAEESNSQPDSAATPALGAILGDLQKLLTQDHSQTDVSVSAADHSRTEPGEETQTNYCPSTAASSPPQTLITQTSNRSSGSSKQNKKKSKQKCKNNKYRK